MVDNWLSLGEEDGSIERLTRLSSKDDMAQGNSLLQNNIKRKFFDDHIWLSIGYRKSRSAFTRVQRLCCCLAILYLMMITNAMFYGQGDEGGGETAIEIGPISMSAVQLYTSIISSLIVMPPILLITTIFTRARPRPKITADSGKHDNQAAAMGAGERADSKKAKGWPWWTIYVGYTVVVLAVASSAFFTILYAFQWGKQKSEKWLVTFLLGFFESVFLIQPLKVSC